MNRIMNKYKVVEKFISINGEGQKAGELACFIRFAGCNLKCVYCDTAWANEPNVPYESLTAEEILDYIKTSKVKNVTLTGGEPLIQEGIEELLTIISQEDINIEVETNGSVNIEKFKKADGRISFTVDYKSFGSGMESYMMLDNFSLMTMNDTLKFVVTDKNDLDRMKMLIQEYNLTKKTKIYVSCAFMQITPEDVVEYMIENGLNDIRLQLQLHKYIWNPEKRGV